MFDTAIKNRYDFVLLFDADKCCPNGDPDAGNLPRTDSTTGRGLVTDVCLKHKIRNEVALKHEGELGYRMYIQGDSTLNAKDNEAYEAIGIKSRDKVGEYAKSHEDIAETIRNFMCASFYDIRTFGAVMTSFSSAKLGCGAVRGPVQMTCAESISPVEVEEMTVGRCAVTTEKEKEDGKQNNFAPKAIIRYGLYKCYGSVDATLAQKWTNFTEQDLDILWDGILNMFEHDKGAIRSGMAVRKLIVFKHDSAYGNAQAHKLFERVKVEAKNPNNPPRCFSDYDIEVDQTSLPAGVTVTIME